jgi:HEAT repeat protein
MRLKLEGGKGSMFFFCPSCWRTVAETDVCPACGADLQHFRGETYEEKLIRSLSHPEPTAPVRAATILGELGSKAAVEPLIVLVISNPDPYIQEAAVIALGRIGDDRATPHLENLALEGWLRVRRAARRALERLRSEEVAGKIA